MNIAQIVCSCLMALAPEAESASQLDVLPIVTTPVEQSGGSAVILGLQTNMKITRRTSNQYLRLELFNFEVQLVNNPWMIADPYIEGRYDFAVFNTEFFNGYYERKIRPHLHFIMDAGLYRTSDRILATDGFGIIAPGVVVPILGNSKHIAGTRRYFLDVLFYPAQLILFSSFISRDLTQTDLRSQINAEIGVRAGMQGNQRLNMDLTSSFIINLTNEHLARWLTEAVVVFRITKHLNLYLSTEFVYPINNAPLWVYNHYAQDLFDDPHIRTLFGCCFRWQRAD